MKGKTNVYLSKGGGEKLHLTLKTNQESHSDIIGAVVTVSYDDIVETYTWNDKELVISLPIDIEYTASFSNIEGYKTPDSISYISSIDTNRFITVVYETELVTINVSVEEGNISDYEVSINKVTKYEEEYTQIEYIESTGTLYIDTGFKPNQDTRVVMEAECLIDGNNYFLFGARTNNSNNNTASLTYGFNAYNTIYRTHYYNGWSDFATSISFTDKFVIDKNKNITTIGGSNSINRTYTNFLCAYNMYLFAVNTKGTAGTFAKAKVYSCQIYDNGTLIRDYIPVVNSSDVAGLYDKVNKVFYPSNSSTAFNAGNTIKELIATQTTSSVIYKIPYDTVYQISASNIDGYSTPEQMSFTANLSSRTVEIMYETGLPAGTTYEFEYTGTILEVELPKGRYKLQCWGAQGGNVTGTYAVAGAKGGYSEGEITLTEPTTFYVFVGGKGTNYTSSPTQTSTDRINGGWNGGGGGLRTLIFENTTYNIKSFPRGGGGATDISTVTSSSMNYSTNRTARDKASLLARCIVAGGGAGACASYQISKEGVWISSGGVIFLNFEEEVDGLYHFSGTTSNLYKNKPIKYKIANNRGFSMVNMYVELVYLDNVTLIESTLEDDAITFIAPDSSGLLKVHLIMDGKDPDYNYNLSMYMLFKEEYVKSNTTNVGGGTTGGGLYPGKQNTYGGFNGLYEASFGYGGNVITTYSGYKGYIGGAGGAGWYGGGTTDSNSIDSTLESGGGSGFVNIASNASYRPSGYTGLELDSGTTIAGNTSHPSVSGGTETGHSGNGYARITAL